MVMAGRILEPEVTLRQAPQVTFHFPNMGPMVTTGPEYKDRVAFAQRLNQALDEAGFPPKNSGRQTKAAKLWGLSQKGARKWLEAEAMPDTHRVPMIVRKLNGLAPDLPPIREEWLLFGRGPMRETSTREESIEAAENELITLFRKTSAKGQLDILAYAELTSERYPRVKGDLPPQHITGSHYMSPEAVEHMHRVMEDPSEPRYNFTDNANKDTPTRELLGANVVALPNARAPRDTPNLQCFAALTCALRQVTRERGNPEIVSAIYALITQSGEVLRGTQNVHASQIGDLMRAIDLLALQLNEIYEEALRRELAESQKRRDRRRAKRGQLLPV